MKRMLSLILSLALAASLAMPARAMAPSAQPDMESALADMAAAVKATLDIGDDYTEFVGNYNDGLVPGWYLRWVNEEGELAVTCTEDAVVTELYRYQTADGGTLFYGFDPVFPARGEADARKAAEAWLARLMGTGESARIDDMRILLSGDGTYRFTGHILKNGLESPVSFELRLDDSGPASYSRSDGYRGYVGALPAPLPAAGEDDAAALLRQSVRTELYYITAPDGQARLRYVPVGAYTVVDALTGEAVDMDALYASFGSSARGGAETPMMAEASMDSGMGRGLTEVELSSIANYRDALTQEALDAALRAVPELGLDGFDLVRCSYAMDVEGDITANLRYACEMTEDRLFGFSRAAFDEYAAWGDTPMVYKYLAVDAKTGVLQSVSTSYPLWDGDRSDRGGDGAEATARSFLASCAPERFAESALCTLKAVEGREGLTFARVHDGCFFPENYLRVTVDPAEQCVELYDCVWDDGAEFAPARGVVSEAAAHAAYIDALDLTLGYAAWPEGIDYTDPILARYAEWGYGFVESLRLAWYYGGTDRVAGVDALTGEAVTEEPDEGYVYDDLAADARREAVERLGRAGIGFAGGRFRPNEALTQREALLLLTQAAGYRSDGWDDGQLRSEAVYLGFFTAEQWAPDGAVTRMDFIRMVIGASRYGAAAELEGIWADSFTDTPAAYRGYAAIARSLGMVAGDPLLPDAACTRGAAAVMLYGFMTR